MYILALAATMLLCFDIVIIELVIAIPGHPHHERKHMVFLRN